ncbi:protein BREVIS RADIX [Dorcoceras hygrometricum]|uniref:Protein BREVIS RADIX n=1 Tax=Dorcoceras hygrometricum TaxID=472368 RepID=A0A2Z7CE87_9LAMI|nr:protein BREVIS RADIX [Dorcoceras hygrometricum]
MLTCITCSKQRDDDEDDAPRGTPSTKDAVKSLTTQIKDMALKVSGSSSSKGKPGQTDNIFKRGQRSYPDFDTISEGVPYSYAQPGSSSSTPAWDFTKSGHRAKRPDSTFTVFGGDRTTGGVDSFSAHAGETALENDNEPKEWMAQVEPGVQITFVSLPRGGNDLKRIRFNREMFNKWQAQRWWGENYDRIMELYNVQKFNQQGFNTPGRSEDGRDSTYSRLGTALESPRMTPRYNLQGSGQYYNPGSSAYPSSGMKSEMPMEASRMTTSSRDEASVSISNASDIESEWIEEDEPGVYITIRQLVDGTRELRRVRFSREKFGEVHAKLWWDSNRDRIQAQYLC